MDLSMWASPGVAWTSLQHGECFQGRAFHKNQVETIAFNDLGVQVTEHPSAIVTSQSRFKGGDCRIHLSMGGMSVSHPKKNCEGWEKQLWLFWKKYIIQNLSTSE